MFKFKSVIIFLLLCLTISTIVIAQDETGECYFEVDEESYIELGETDLLDCAGLLLDNGFDYELDEVYGYWGEFYVYVNANGEIYWLDESNEWVFWGTLPATAEAEEETEAGDENAECYFEVDEESYIELGSNQFIDCAALIIEYGASYDYSEAYGYWDDYYIYVGGDGAVSWLDVENDEWVYWGTLSGNSTVESSVDNTGTTSSVPLDLNETFALAELDINVFWEQVFEGWEFAYSQPAIYVIQRGDVNSPCGPIGDSTGPVYCGGDNAIYLPLGFMQDQHSRIGDYAVVVVIAHEWGHSVEQQLGYYDEDLGLGSVQTEIIADCLAGAYTNYLISTSQNAIIDEGDIDEAITSMFEAGDNRVWFDERTHGTSDERMAAFRDGMEHGEMLCLE